VSDTPVQPGTGTLLASVMHDTKLMVPHDPIAYFLDAAVAPTIYYQLI
jgi:hypothetical protein